jgi:hypothetical protein
MVPKNTKKILLFLLKNINELGFNINQISKNNEISVGSSFKILKNLEKSQILTKKQINNALHFKLDFNNIETIKLCELLLLEEKRNLKGYAKIYADEIIKFKTAKIIILFGSIINKKSFNDVDALFVTNKINEVNDFCLEISKIKSKPVVPLILKEEDLINEIKNQKDSIIDIIKTGIILDGCDYFIQLLKKL